MRRSHIVLGSVSLALLLLTACGDNVEERAASGGLGGAAAGALVGGPVGAIVGGAAGATGGTMVQKGLDENADEVVDDEPTD